MIRVLLILIASLLVVIQTTVANMFAIREAKIELLPSLMVYCAMTTNLPTALLVACCGALLQDALSAGRFGLSLLPLCGVAIFLFRVRLLLLRDFIVVQSLLGGAAAMVTAGWMVLCQIFTADRNIFYGSTIAAIFWVVVASAVVTPCLFRVLDRIVQMIGHAPEKAESL